MQSNPKTGEKGDNQKEIDKRCKEGLDFLKVFANNKIVDDYPMLINVKATLREYSKEGINWMA